MNRTNQAAIQRILLALDASPQSVAALDTAMELAGRLRAELTGLFVEDTDLLRMAALPFAAEIGRLSPTLRRLSLPDMERQLRAQAEHMRKAIAVAAAREGVKWEFRVARGSVAAEILLAGMRADLVILGKRGWSLSKRLGSSVQMVISKGQGLILVLHPGIKFTIPVVVIYDGSDVARKGLDAAANLVKIRDGNLRVIVIAESREKSAELQGEAVQYLTTQGLEGKVGVMIEPTKDRLAQFLRSQGPVVLPCGSELLVGEGLCELVNLIENPVLLVR